MKAPCVQLRLEREKLLKYQVEAAQREMTLVDYLRDRLDRADLSDELINLKMAFEGLHGSRDNAGARSHSMADAALLEVLLLLRSSATPQTITKSQMIIRQMGHEPVTMDKGK